MPYYLLTYFFNSFSLYVKKDQRKFVEILGLIFLIFLSGTRYCLAGSDYYVYEGVFNTNASIVNILKYIFTGVNNGVNINYEPGFLLLNSIVKALGFNYHGFILIVAIIFYSFLYCGVKRITNQWGLVSCLFMYKLMFYNTFISIRQGLTIAIFIFGLRYIIEKKPIKYFLLCFICYYIHRASLFIFPLYFCRYLPVSKKILKTVAILFIPTWFIRGVVNLEGPIMSIISFIGFESKSEGWASSMEGISLIHTLECYIIVFLVIYFWDKLDMKDNTQKMMVQFLLVLIPIFTLLSNWILFTRLKDYLIIVYAILLTYIITRSRTGDLNRVKEMKFIKLVRPAFLMCCLVGMIRYVFVFDGGVLMKFDSILFHFLSIFS